MGNLGSQELATRSDFYTIGVKIFFCENVDRGSLEAHTTWSRALECIKDMLYKNRTLYFDLRLPIIKISKAVHFHYAPKSPKPHNQSTFILLETVRPDWPFLPSFSSVPLNLLLLDT